MRRLYDGYILDRDEGLPLQRATVLGRDGPCVHPRRVRCLI